MKLKKKNTAVKKSPMRPISREKSMVVHPVQLPMAPEVKKSPKRRILLTLVMMVLTAFIWGWLVYEALMIFYPPRACPLKQIPVLPETVQGTVPAVPQYAENVVAVVGEEPITIDQIKDFVKQVPQLSEVPFQQIYPKMLDLYINNKVIQMGAAEMRLPQEAKIQQMIQMAKDQIITQAYLTRVLDQALTEQDLKDFYQEQVRAFQSQPEVHARHILVDTQAQAKDVLIQLKAGADFATLANQKSLDKNAQNGDLGYFTREMMIPEFAKAAFNMQKGELSNPVRTAYGWHVIQVLDKRMTQPPKFEEVKDQLRQAVMERKVPEILQQERTKRNVQILRPTME